MPARLASDLPDRTFWLATEAEILRGETTDIYFHYAQQTLARDQRNPTVIVEVYTRTLPYPDNWGIVAGIYEVAKLLQGKPITAWAMEEGELFIADPHLAIYEPVLQLRGAYRDLAPFENPVLGFLCCGTGIATRAARVKLQAQDKPVFSFGSRRAHPAIGPFIERCAYVAGFDAVSNVLGARLLGVQPVGTMPHALILCYGHPPVAWQAFDRAMPPEVSRIVLADTFADEKTEALLAWETLGERLHGLRFDTPSTRRGDLPKILQEVRWELNARGAHSVKLYLSGGLDDMSIGQYAAYVDGFGVGTSVASPPAVDFSFKVVEVHEEGRRHLRAKRGDLAGQKQVYRAPHRLDDIVQLAQHPAPRGYHPLLQPLLHEGKLVRPLRRLKELRTRTLRRLDQLRSSPPKLRAA